MLLTPKSIFCGENKIIMEDLVSIVVPVFRVEKYLEKCIDSLLRQTYENIEIIIVDDGSDDACPEICDRYAQKDKRITVIHKKNGGLSEARNVGLDIAKGQFIAFVDGDDYVSKRYIDILYTIVQKTECDIAQCGYISVIDDFEEIEESNYSYNIFTPKQMIIQSFVLLGWKCNIAWNKLYKKELFKNIRYPIGKIHEDEITTYQLIWAANSIAITNSRLYCYRQRTDSIMGKRYSLNHMDAQIAFIEQEKYYKEMNEKFLLQLVKNKYLKWINNQIRLIAKYEEDFNNTIDKLEAEKNRINSDGTCFENSIFHGYIFPYARVKRSEQIILYGAGDVGKQFFKQIVETDYCDVKYWIDSNAKEKVDLGFSIKTFDEIEYNNEKIVIAINNNEIAQQIIASLRDFYNIERDKIIYDICNF